MARRPSHYYFCTRKGKTFLREQRCPQRYIDADALDELVWEEVSTRLQGPDLLLEAHRECRAQRIDREEASSSEQMQKLASQIKLTNNERTRLLDAYQAGAMELAELQKRRRLVDAKLDALSREKDLLEKMAREQKQEGDGRADLEEFSALVSGRLQHFSFGGKQKLLRTVLDKVVVKDWRVDVPYNIPLPQPSRPMGQGVSTKFDLCCEGRTHRKLQQCRSTVAGGQTAPPGPGSRIPQPRSSARLPLWYLRHRTQLGFCQCGNRP
jgi:site-specific DNA recombinase